MRPQRTQDRPSGRVLHKLTRERIAQILKTNETGKHADGGKLYLRVRDGKAPTWSFIFQALDGRQRLLALGNARDVPVDRARELARAAREQLAAGIDPVAERGEVKRRAREEREQVRVEAVRDAATLLRESRRMHELVSGTFRNPKHAAQWISSIETHVPAEVLRKPIADVTAADLLGFLQPLYVELAETAKRVRQRLDAVFDDALLRGLCAGNPAAAVKRTLTKLSGKRKREGFAALAWSKVPAFTKRLRAAEGLAARMLEFVILTAARTGETLFAEWSEIDTKQGTWVIPAGRMKGGETHTVFLAPRALAILESCRGLDDKWIFPSLAKPGQPLSNMAMLELLKGMKVEATVHGFRSSFSTWANEHGYRPDVIEACLAHRESDRVRAAYNRAAFLAERKQLLTDWAQYVGTEKTPATVTSLSARKRAKAR